MLPKSLIRIVLALVCGLFLTACTPEVIEDVLPVEADPRNEVIADPLSSETDLGKIVALLRSGLPDYDYEPAADLEALIDQSDVVLTGSIDSVVRPPGGTHTVISVSDLQVLHLSPALDGEESEWSVISMFSVWAQGEEPHPLAAPIDIEGVDFVAFLLHGAGPHGGLLVDVQGLVVGCTGSEERAKVIVEPLPRDASGLSVAELTEAVLLARTVLVEAGG